MAARRPAKIASSKKGKATAKVHPETGKPGRRAIVAPNVAGKWSPLKEKSVLSNKNLERLGFTKYEKKGDGVMERVAGKEGTREIREG